MKDRMCVAMRYIALRRITLRAQRNQYTPPGGQGCLCLICKKSVLSGNLFIK